MDFDKETEILSEILLERVNQDTKWGEQNLPFATAGALRNFVDCRSLKAARDAYEHGCELGDLSFLDILNEELWEVVEAENDIESRKELVQLGAVVVQAIAALDRNLKLKEKKETT